MSDQDKSSVKYNSIVNIITLSFGIASAIYGIQTFLYKPEKDTKIDAMIDNEFILTKYKIENIMSELSKQKQEIRSAIDNLSKFQASPEFPLSLQVEKIKHDIDAINEKINKVDQLYSILGQRDPIETLRLVRLADSIKSLEASDADMKSRYDVQITEMKQSVSKMEGYIVTLFLGILAIFSPVAISGVRSIWRRTHNDPAKDPAKQHSSSS
jgi:hypothetical protein